MKNEKKHVLTIEFENEALLKEFAGWMCDGGGECEFYDAIQMRTGKKLSFKYHKEDERKAVNDPNRYGPFLFGDEKKFVIKEYK